MINLSPKNQYGAAILVVTIVLLVASTLIIIFAANQGQILQKLSSNQYRNTAAFEAAEAGIELGIQHLQQNRTTILANPVSGLILPYSNAAITNVTLANNSKFTVVYSNPILLNYELILITSTGRSDDDTATRVATQLVQFGSLLSTPPVQPVESQGAVNLNGHATVTNLEGTNAIGSASTISFGGSSTTVTQAGVGNPASADQNDPTLQGLSQADFFARYFGSTIEDVKSKVSNYYSSSSNTNYSSTLNGMTGTSIWIDQLSNSTTTLNGNITIGSAANPVVLVINGNLAVSGSVTIYGFVFNIGTTGINTLTGNTEIIGSFVSTDTLNMTGSIAITYNSTVLNNLRTQSSMSYYAKVPGAWKDF